MTPTEQDNELRELEKEIVSEEEPDQFIDLLAAQHYFAGKFGNKVPVDSARRMFEVWLAKHDKKLIQKAREEAEIGARIDEIEKMSHTKWRDIAYDIAGYIKNRLAELKKSKEEK